MFKRILVPTDGSDLSLLAAQHVADAAAGAPDVHVTVIVAIAPVDPEKSDLDEATVKRQNDHMRREAELALNRTAQVFDERNISHTARVIIGDPVSVAIADEADTGHYDLIAMASRGLGLPKTDHHYIGSVTEHVLRRVKVPVLVLPLHKGK
jgi:nucleotide-binding universal stress UspA family protein